MNIAYTLVGMTRGHAARALAVGSELIERGHDVRFYTNLDAYELLTARFGFERVFEIEMPKYIFREGKIDLFATLIENLGFVFRRGKYTKPIFETFEQWTPDVTVSDFEPLAWWVAQKLNIPHVTLDSQRFMVSSEMPKRLPMVDNIQRLLTHITLFTFSPTASRRVVSKPFAIPYEASRDHYVGAITRMKMDCLVWRPQGDYFLVYIKESLTPRLVEIDRLAALRGLTGRVFGIPAHYLEGFSHLEHGKTCQDGFLETLSTSEFVVTTPGSQTLAETWTLGIPSYLLPEPNQFEQQINLLLATQAAPTQYARFTDGESAHEVKLEGPKVKNCTSAGRKRAASVIESLEQ